MTIAAGTTLTCTNDDCPCRLVVQVPCPHGDDYTCGCGHPFAVAHDGGGESVSDADPQAGVSGGEGGSGGSIPPTPGA